MSEHDPVVPLDDDADVAELRRTFDSYSTTGRSARWEGRELGARLATEERNRWLVHSAESFAFGTVVDLGCGDANVAVALTRAAHQPARYVGVDIIEPRLALAASRYPAGEYLLASVTALPIPESSCDLVVACVLFSSLPSGAPRVAAASEIRRILRPGGRALIYDMRYPSPGNSAVRPFGARDIQSHFETWATTVTTLTLLPPLARTWAGGSRRRYHLLTRLPFLRSHVGVALTKP